MPQTSGDKKYKRILLKLSGEVNDPYPEGKLGVIEEGAYADLLLVDGNPLEDITAIGGSEKWFDAPDRDGIDTMRIIMKDGKIAKGMPSWPSSFTW